MYGGVYNFDKASGTIKSTIFINNYSRYGGIMYAVDQSNIIISGCTINYNYALIEGGVIAIER